MANLNSFSKGMPSLSCSSEKQGYLGDLHLKSKHELLEILHRQETLLKNNKNLLKKLPDKGAKIEATIARVKEALAHKQSTDSVSSLFEQMSLSAETSRFKRTSTKSPDSTNNTEMNELLGTIINTPERDKVVLTEPYPETDDGKTSSDVDPILKKYVQIEEYSKQQKEKQRSLFVPHNSLKNKDPHEIAAKMFEENQATSSVSSQTESAQASPSQKSAQSKRNPGKTLQEKGAPASKLKFRYDESLEQSVFGDTTHQRHTQMMDLGSAVQLEKEKTRKIQDLQTQQAIEKLAQRFGLDDAATFHTSAFHTPRLHADEDDEEDESEGEMDYPD